MKYFSGIQCSYCMQNLRSLKIVKVFFTAKLFKGRHWDNNESFEVFYPRNVTLDIEE